MGIFAYLAICILWGLSSVSIKLGLEHIELFTFSFLRFLTTSLILLIYNIARRKSIQIRKEDFKVIFISATLMFFLNSILITLATERLDAGIIPIILSLVPMAMVIIESILEKKLLVGGIGILGILGGVVGIGVISLGGASLKIDALGLAFVGLAVICWSSGSIYLRHKRIEASIPVLLMYQTMTPLIYYGIILLFKGGLSFEYNAVSFGGMFYMAIADTIIGSACYVYLLKNWKTSIVSTYAYINPIVGLIGAYFLLGENISLQKVQGMVIILASVFLIQSDGKLRVKLVEIKKKRRKKLG